MEFAIPAVDPDDEAMGRVARGESDALALLFDRHKARLFGFLYHIVGDRATAEDLLGETFLKLYRERGRYRRGSTFVPWVLAIARNLALGELRRRGVAVRAEERLMVESGSDEPACDPERDWTRDRVREALLDLPEDQRAAVVLKEYHDLSYREVGHVLGCSEEAARARTYRARATLRDALKDVVESG